LNIPNKRRLSIVAINQLPIGLVFYDEKIKPKDERPERTGEAKENRGHSSAHKAQQENGLATDVIGKTTPL